MGTRLRYGWFFATLFAVIFAAPVVSADMMPLRREPVQLSLIAAGPLQAGLEVRLQPGWKFYWRSPGEGGVPPRFDWSASQNLAAVDIAWPAPRRISIGNADLHGYTGEVVLPIALSAADVSRPVMLDLTLEYGICKDICILREERLSRLLPPDAAIDGTTAAKLARWRAAVPVPAGAAGIRLLSHRAAPGQLTILLAAEQPLEKPDLFIEGSPEAWFGRPEVALTDGGRQARFVIAVQPADAAASLPLTLTVMDAGRAAELTVQ